MDNLTHSLIGLAASKAGLDRLSPGATTVCILAANSPDADIVALIFGRWTFLQHHRGITHSIAGAMVLALALPLLFYLGDLIIARLRERSPSVKLKGLIVASIIATATHPLMDWTNNYGVRFLLPWDSRWSYGDFVFIIDPFIWVVLGGAAFLLTSKTWKQIIVWLVIALSSSYLVLVGPSGSTRLENEVIIRVLWVVALIVLASLYRRKIGGRLGSRMAIAALATVAIYCAGLAIVHSVALSKAKAIAGDIADSSGEQVVKVAAMPTVANPTVWLCVMETNRATYRFGLSLLGTAPWPRSVSRFEKPQGAEAVAMAEAARERPAQMFLGFARFPVIEVIGEDCASQTLVQFADLRYTEPGKSMGTFSLDVPVDCPVLNK